MSETVKLLLSLSLSGSILAVFIFAVKPLIIHRFSKSIQYYLWIVVLLRLVLPFSFETSIMNNLFYGQQTSVATTSLDEIQPVGVVGEGTINSSILPNIQVNAGNGDYNNDVDHSRFFQDLFYRYALYLWLLGVILALAINLIGYARFIKCLKQANKAAAEEENRMLAALLNGQIKVRLVRNPFVTTPMLIGILRPIIVIPDIDFDEKQLKNILLHEICHLKRFDIAIKWLATIAASIHWFNPMMYVIRKEINQACELACDEAVVKTLSPEEKQAYGETLISVVAERKYPIGVLQATMCEEKNNLKERLVAIMKHTKKSRLIMVLSGVLLGAVIFGAFYLGAGVGGGKDTPPKIYISAAGEARVGMLTYDLTGISKYKTPYVGDSSKVSAIAGRLPVPDQYFKQQYISMKTSEKPYSLTIYYEAASDTEYEGMWPIVTADSVMEMNSRANALVVFSMIDNLGKVTFAYRITQSNGELEPSKYNTTFTFQRASFEEQYGDLSVLGENLDLLIDALTGKKSAFKGLELYVWSKPELTGNSDLYYTLLIGTNRNKTEGEVYNLDDATSDLNLLKQELSRYSDGIHLSIIHDITIDKETMAKIGDQLAGAIKNGSISIGGREFSKD